MNNVQELLDFCGSGKLAASREMIVDHLLDRVLPTAYSQKPGYPRLAYDLETAQHALRHIAAQMNLEKTRDLRWWLIPSWIPRAARVLITGVVVGVGVGVAAGVGVVAGARIGVVAGVALGVMLGVIAGVQSRTHTEFDNAPQPIGRIRWREICQGLYLRNGVTTGLMSGLMSGFLVGVTAGVPAGVVAGVGSGSRLELRAGSRSG